MVKDFESWVCIDGLGLHMASFNPESNLGLAECLKLLVKLTPRLPGWTVGSYNPRIASPAGGWCRGTSWQVLAREICGSRRGQQGRIIRVYSCDSSLVPGYSWTSHSNCSPINDTFFEAKLEPSHCKLSTSFSCLKLNHWTNPIAKSWHSWEAGLLLPKSQKPNEGEVVAAGPGEVWWLRQTGSKLEELDVGGLQGAVMYKATLFFVSWNLVEPDLIGIRYENRGCQWGFHQNLAFKVGNVSQVTLHPWRPTPNLASWCPCLWRSVKRPGRWSFFYLSPLWEAIHGV